MTAIAFDGRFLVADSFCDVGGFLRIGDEKIVSLVDTRGDVTPRRHIWAAGAGNVALIQHLFAECRRSPKAWEATFKLLHGCDGRPDALMVVQNESGLGVTAYSLKGTNTEVIWFKEQESYAIGAEWEAMDMMLRIGFDATDVVLMACELTSNARLPMFRLDTLTWSHTQVSSEELVERRACIQAAVHHRYKHGNPATRSDA
jgi:hypothetical protein